MKKIKLAFNNLFINPHRFEIINEYVPKKKLKILDIGCGNHSPTFTKKYLPNCEYYGLDKLDCYNLNSEDFKKIDKFFKLDLNRSKLDEIHDNFFDLVIMSHIIEHLIKGEEVLSNIIKKLKTNGLIFIEFPSYHTIYLPSLKKFGVTFNFYDDITHKRLYKKQEIIKFLKKNNYEIIKAEIYFSFKRLIFLPVILPYLYFKIGFDSLYNLWYLFGWCTYIIAKRNI